MAYQSNQPKSPVLNHYSLVKNGPRLVAIKSPPKWVKNDTLCVIELIVDGKDHVYFTNNREVAAKFMPCVGKSVVLIASGNSKQGTDTMEIQEAGVPASSLAQRPAAKQPVKEQEKPAQRKEEPAAKPVARPATVSAPPHPDKEAKVFLCQAANLMRLCVKKANDIAIELDLPNEHRQGIASSLFIQADRNGFTTKMPVTAYTPDQLGYGASKAESLAKPEPNEEQ
jgi:hypothetical protein